MRTVALGDGDVRLPVIGQGTWHMGASRRARAREVEALQLGISLGLTLIDTAEFYAAGGAEEVVGEAIRGQRERVFVVTKVWPAHADARGVEQAVRGSLRRLRTDYLDAVLLHWPTRAVPLATTLGAFARLAAQGVIRCFGVSNFDVPWLEAAEAALPPGARVALHQVSYSLCDRRPEARVLPFAAARGQVVMAYSPLCRGRLPAGGGALEEVARARGVSPATVALAFLVSRPGVVAIPKAVRPEHVRANAAAGDLVLTPEELARLEAAFPRGDRTALDTLPTSGWFFRLAWATIRVWHGLVR